MCAYNTGSLNVCNLRPKKLLNFAASSNVETASSFSCCLMNFVLQHNEELSHQGAELVGRAKNFKEQIRIM
jgi:hypothetical protein